MSLHQSVGYDVYKYVDFFFDTTQYETVLYGWELGFLLSEKPQNFDFKLQNYELGIIEDTSPLNLDRREDYY